MRVKEWKLRFLYVRIVRAVESGGGAVVGAAGVARNVACTDESELYCREKKNE